MRVATKPDMDRAARVTKTLEGLPLVPPHPAPANRWHLVVPVRGGLAGKTRLVSIEGRSLSDPDRVQLAGAMAADTVAAAVASGCGPVSVLTADPDTATMATHLGAGTIEDLGGGLNQAVGAAADRVEPGVGLVVLLGDVPAVRGVDIATATVLGEEEGRAFVPDWEGTGTTLVAFSARERDRVRLGFGVGSAQRHTQLGLVAIGEHLDRLRCDVDTPRAWERALALGLGPATTAARLRLLGRTGQ